LPVRRGRREGASRGRCRPGDGPDLRRHVRGRYRQGHEPLRRAARSRGPGMRLDRMLWHCLQPGATALEDSGTKVTLTPGEGETALFFRIDGPEFREGDAGMRVADLLVVVRKAGVGRAVMMYVELKGSRRYTGDALEQLQTAIEKVEA